MWAEPSALDNASCSGAVIRVGGKYRVRVLANIQTNKSRTCRAHLRGDAVAWEIADRQKTIRKCRYLRFAWKRADGELHQRAGYMTLRKNNLMITCPVITLRRFKDERSSNLQWAPSDDRGLWWQSPVSDSSRIAGTLAMMSPNRPSSDNDELHYAMRINRFILAVFIFVNPPAIQDFYHSSIHLPFTDVYDSIISSLQFIMNNGLPFLIWNLINIR